MPISTEYKIDCSKCFTTERLLSSTKKEATEEAKRIGWKVAKNNLCPECKGETK